MRLWTLLLLCSACAPLPAGGKTAEQADQEPPMRLVTTERRTGGAALIFIDETGRRIADLTSTAGQRVVDRQPSFDPDGQWVAFASNRGREEPESTSLWLVEARAGADLVRVTDGKSVDRDPVWDPGGKSLIFASNRGGSFDIYRQPLTRSDDRVAPRGRPLRLTDTAGQALAPTVSPDGRWVVFMQVAKDGSSTLWRVAGRGGSAEQLTRGPTDVTPTFSPDGKTIYFAARAQGRSDADVFAIGVRGNGKRVVISEPDADQSGPRLSSDGKVLFATALYRSQATGRPVLASVVAAVLDDEPKWRVLHDPAVVESRVGVAVAPGTLAVDVLAKNPDYGPGLRRALERALRDTAAEDRARAQKRGEGRASPDKPSPPP
jgi:Tol biopolymer transport system component